LGRWLVGSAVEDVATAIGGPQQMADKISGLSCERHIWKNI